MINSIKINDKVKLINSDVLTVYKIVNDKYINGNEIYGIGFDPVHPGNFDWYFENGKPVTYWANFQLKKIIKETKTIIEIVKNDDE